MSLDLDDPRIARCLARLAPYAVELLRRAGAHALRLHADVVTPDHLLSTLMEDPECGAHAAVLHAFADPATISDEALAISPGIMVVASASTLPFSPRGARALLRARELASRRAASEVDERHLAVASADDLAPDARRVLVAVGLRIEALANELGAETEGAQPFEGALFRHFSAGARRALSAANRTAASLRLRAISPAHILLGCLKEKTALEATAGVGFRRASLALAGLTADESAPAPRRLPPDQALVAFLEGVPPGSDSVGLLASYHSGSTPELAQILIRQKVTSAFLERARGVFGDPEAGG